VEVDVLPGYKAGTKLTFAGAGHQKPDGTFQSVVFKLEEKPHETFSRDGDDLILKRKVPLVDALCGSTTATVEGIDSKPLHVKIPNSIIKPGMESTVVGEGMPRRKSGTTNGRGNLVVKWDVVFPDRLNMAQKEAIRRALSN